MWEKVARIKWILEPIIATKRLYLLNWKHTELLKEMFSFPSSPHDDQLDALSWRIKLVWLDSMVMWIDEYWNIDWMDNYWYNQFDLDRYRE